MEQPLWIYIGVIAVLLAIGIIVHMTVLSNDVRKVEVSKESLKKLQQQCDFVCKQDTGTMLGVAAELFSGSKLYAAEKAICLDSVNLHDCVSCNCQLANYVLDLNTAEARQAFVSHNYRCTFEKSKSEVSMRCAG